MNLHDQWRVISFLKSIKPVKKKFIKNLQENNVSHGTLPYLPTCHRHEIGYSLLLVHFWELCWHCPHSPASPPPVRTPWRSWGTWPPSLASCRMGSSPGQTNSSSLPINRVPVPTFPYRGHVNEKSYSYSAILMLYFFRFTTGRYRA